VNRKHKLISAFLVFLFWGEASDRVRHDASWIAIEVVAVEVSQSIALASVSTCGGLILFSCNSQAILHLAASIGKITSLQRHNNDV
jgi:hypothetical protein